MKRIAKTLMTFVIGFLLISGSAISAPIKFDFRGDYTVKELNTDEYSLEFSSGYDMHGNEMPYSGLISRTFTPQDDKIFSDPAGEFVEINTLQFSQDASGDFVFDSTEYNDGFKVWDYNSDSKKFDLLFSATLVVSKIVDLGTTSSINPDFALNLTDIVAGTSYASSSSKIVDAFLNPIGGATTITLQWGGEGQFVPESSGAYSGTAAPVPEPATIVLFGAGLMGLAAYGRARNRRK